MEDKDYVTYDVALKLKEKHLCQYSNKHYFIKDINIKNVISVPSKILTDAFSLDNTLDNIRVYAPTLYEVQKCFREKYKLDINSQYDFIDDNWFYSFCSIHVGIDILESSESIYKSYEEALNEGIKQSLKFI